MAASPNVQGGSSGSGVVTGPSTHFLFDTGNSGLRLNGDIYGYIDIADGPLRGSNAAIEEYGNGGFLQPKHVIGGSLSWPNIAQVWKDIASVNGTGSGPAYFAVNSIRQIQTFPPLIPAPQFGGLVIGQVGTPVIEDGNVVDVASLPVGSGVYFGEWAPKVNSDPVGTNLNMASNERVVWYVGDNAVKNGELPTLVNAIYGVIGINRTGTDASNNTLPGGLPDDLNLYTGKLTVNYVNPVGGAITGSIARGSDSINFAGTNIHATNGTFANTDPTKNIEGRFYNGAEALAGIYKGSLSSATDDVAFGGSRID